MEFKGIISKVYPVKSGTSQRGDWKLMPFVFEWFENPNDQWSRKTVVETLDTGIMKQILPFLRKDAEGKPIITDKCYALTQQVKCKVDLQLSMREYTTKQFELGYTNQTRARSFALLEEAPAELTDEQKAALEAAKQLGTDAQPQEEKKDDDDLPF